MAWMRPLNQQTWGPQSASVWSMLDFVQWTAAESERFQQAATAIADSGGGSPLTSVAVPSCPDWKAADLIWHLAEVQYFWASIVEGNLASPAAVEEAVRPSDNGLLRFSADQAARLVEQLAGHGAGEPCWSWHDDGHSVGWVRRRQAHEALIHRVDAELALETISPGSRTEVNEELATDGIDEILAVMLDASKLPDWAAFEPDGATARIEVPDRSWSVRLGQFSGTDPDSRSHDEPALVLLPADQQLSGEPHAVVRGPASEIDLWLWRRAPLVEATVDGDRAVAERLRDLAAVH